MQTIISENVKRFRRENDLTQAQTAKIAEMSQATISRIEDGHIPRTNTIQKLAKIMKQPPENLVKGAIERAEEDGEVEFLIKMLKIATAVAREALDGWDSSNKDMIFFSAVFFALGLLLGASTLMFIVGLLS